MILMMCSEKKMGKPITNLSYRVIVSDVMNNFGNLIFTVEAANTLLLSEALQEWLQSALIFHCILPLLYSSM